MRQIIIQAIQDKFLLKFIYDGGIRIVETYCYGQTAKGNDVIRAFQVGGYSSTGKLGWKLFDLSKAHSITLLEEKFDNPQSGYARGDRGMSVIYLEL